MFALGTHIICIIRHLTAGPHNEKNHSDHRLSQNRCMWHMCLLHSQGSCLGRWALTAHNLTPRARHCLTRDFESSEVDLFGQTVATPQSLRLACGQSDGAWAERKCVCSCPPEQKFILNCLNVTCAIRSEYLNVSASIGTCLHSKYQSLVREQQRHRIT